MAKIETGKFVHVVASVRLAQGTGQILYVNPSSVKSAPGPDEVATADAGLSPAGPRGFELIAEDAQGVELARVRPAIQTSSCEDEGGVPETGLVDEDIPFVQGMKRVVLTYNGQRASVYEAAAPQPPAAGQPKLTAGPTPAGADKRIMTVEGAPVPQAGVSYTVQVKPQDGSVWHTIAVGRKTPEFELDRNQFPGAAQAKVRVLRTNGFEDEVWAEQDVNLGNGS